MTAWTNYWLLEEGDKDIMKPEYAQGILSTYVRGDRTKLLILCNLIELSLGRDTQVFEWLRRYNKEEREWLLRHLNELLNKSTDE
jgi:hypothetical protein